ncbi:hypothetical protein GC173_14020 [bacterium]|nr:hypothetical protein [bacterium]
MTHLRWLFVLMAFSLPSLIRADIYGPYRSIEKTFLQSEAIVVVRVIERVGIVDGKAMTLEEYQESRRGKRREYNPAFTITSRISPWRVELVRPIKGDAFEGPTTTTLVLGLGHCPVLDRHTYNDPELNAIDRLHGMAVSKSPPHTEFARGQCCLVFLERSLYGDVPYEVLNTRAATIEVSPDFAKDLTEAERQDPRVLRELILRESEKDPAVITAASIRGESVQ